MEFFGKSLKSLRCARKEFPAAPLREAIRDSDMGVAIRGWTLVWLTIQARQGG